MQAELQAAPRPWGVTPGANGQTLVRSLTTSELVAIFTCPDRRTRTDERSAANARLVLDSLRALRGFSLASVVADGPQRCRDVLQETRAGLLTLTLRKGGVFRINEPADEVLRGLYANANDLLKRLEDDRWVDKKV